MRASAVKIIGLSAVFALASFALWGESATRDPRAWAFFYGLATMLPWAWFSRCRPAPAPLSPMLGGRWGLFRSYAAYWSMAFGPLIHSATVLAQFQPAKALGFPEQTVARIFLLASVLLWSPVLVSQVASSLHHSGLHGYLISPSGRQLPLIRQLFRINRLAASTLWTTFLRWSRLIKSIIVLSLMIWMPLWALVFARTAAEDPVFVGWSFLMFVSVGTPAVLLWETGLVLLNDRDAKAAIATVVDTGHRWQEAARALASASALEQILPPPPTLVSRRSRL